MSAGPAAPGAMVAERLLVTDGIPTGAADSVAALIARGARAPTAMIHLLTGADRVRRAASWPCRSRRVSGSRPS